VTTIEASIEQANAQHFILSENAMHVVLVVVDNEVLKCDA
jgi:hypothetical protein